MNLKLVFRIYFGIGALMTTMMLVAPAAMLEGYGMTLTDEIKLFTQFVQMCPKISSNLKIITLMTGCINKGIIAREGEIGLSSAGANGFF